MFNIIISLLALGLNMFTATYMAFGYNKKQKQYEIKQSAILDSLSLLDDYFSLKKFDDIEPVKKDEITPKKWLFVNEKFIQS